MFHLFHSLFSQFSCNIPSADQYTDMSILFFINSRYMHYLQLKWIHVYVTTASKL